LTSSGIEVAVVDLGGRFLGVPAPVPGAAGPSEQFQFDGFAEPVTMGVTNMATAGRAIPLKWRLTDLMNNPVDDSSSFVGVFSYQIACDGSAVTDAVEEYASGTSGLQYIGDGNWQFNWSTQRQYSRTCRRMYLKLSDGQTSDQVKFQFK
jgi:hypothetical protein